MAVLTVSARNVDPTFQAADVAGDQFVNDGATEFMVMNTGVAPLAVLVSAARVCNHGFLDHLVETVAAGETFRLGPFKSSRFNNASGLVSVTYQVGADLSDISVAAQRQK